MDCCVLVEVTAVVCRADVPQERLNLSTVGCLYSMTFAMLEAVSQSGVH